VEGGEVRFWLGVTFAALTLHPVAELETVKVVEFAPVADAEPVWVSAVDDLLDWDELERQSGCLWVFLVEQKLEISSESVLAAGAWSDLHGGACALIGEDDE